MLLRGLERRLLVILVVAVFASALVALEGHSGVAVADLQERGHDPSAGSVSGRARSCCARRRRPDPERPRN
eukprot:387596-Pyramimonas_sp.AAC.1